MGTPIAFMSGTTNGFSVGATKRATIGLNTGTSLVSGNNWWNGVDVGSQYLLYSDQFSQGQSVIPTSRPTAWSTPSITDQNLLNLINTLPDRVGLTPFVNINVALQWLQNSQKYLLLKNGYENIVTDGLVLNLDAGWANSYPGTGTVWTDLSGNGINGTLTNGPTLSNDGLGTISFDGTNDYVNTTHTSAYNFTNANFTVEAWVYSNTVASGNYQIICTRATYGNNERSFELYIANDSGTPYIWFGVFNSGWTYVNNQSLTNIQYNQWYHVVATSDGSGNGKIYVNGVLRQTNSSFNTAVTVTTVPFQIGAFSGGATGGWLNGKIGNVRLYNRALSATEVQQNYDVQKSRFGLWGQNLFSGYTEYLDFTKGQSYNGAGTTVSDLSGNGYNGYFNNGSFTTFQGVKCFDATSSSSWISNTLYSFGNNYTIFVWSNMLSKSQVSNWRTLLRSDNPSTGDHELIVEYGGNTLGYYDNKNGTGFNSYGINVADANLENNWILYSLVGENGTSQKVYINDGTLNSSVNKNATGQQLLAIGNYQGGTQQWGYVSNYILYNNQAFTQAQVAQYFNATKQYYGYAPNNIPTYGLVMNLDASNPLSYQGTGTIWRDCSGYGNDGTLINGPGYVTSNQGLITFDGTDDYVYIPSLNWAPTSFTICWYTNGNTILNYNQQITASNAWGAFVFHTTSSGGVFCGTDVANRFTPSEIPDGTYVTSVFQMFAFTINSGSASFYKNGNLIATKSMANSSNWGGLTIGNNSSNTINGTVGAVQVYNRALSAAEIKQNFNAQKARFGL